MVDEFTHARTAEYGPGGGTGLSRAKKWERYLLWFGLPLLLALLCLTAGLIDYRPVANRPAATPPPSVEAMPAVPTPAQSQNRPAEPRAEHDLALERGDRP